MRAEYLSANLELVDFAVSTRRDLGANYPFSVTYREEGAFPILEWDGRAVLDGPLAPPLTEQLRRQPAGSAFLLFGLGRGNAVRRLRAAGIRVPLIFEPRAEILARFLAEGPWDLGETKVVTTLGDLEHIWTSIYGDTKAIELVDTPGYRSHFEGERGDLSARIARLLERTALNDGTLIARGKTWISHILANTPFLQAPSAHHLAGKFQGVPAFIVGAGPSLNHAIGAIHMAREKGIVIAVNSAGRALDRVGVAPHILGCIESIDVSRLFLDVSYLDRVVRVASFTAHPNVLRAGSGPLLTLYEHLPYIAGPFQDVFDAPGFPVCASVSTAMFSLAVRMGCNPIVFLGQDLAYPNGHCYAQGTAYEDARVEASSDGCSLVHERPAVMVQTHEAANSQLVSEEPLEEVPAWGGQGTVSSVPQFAQIRLWLSRAVQLLRENQSETRFINASVGGAHMEGWEDLPLEQVLAGLPSRRVDPSEIVSAAHQGRSAPTPAQILAFLRRQRDGALAVVHACRDLELAVAQAERAYRQNPEHGVKKELTEIEVLERFLREKVSACAWADAFSFVEVTSAMQPLPGDEGLAPWLMSLRVEGRIAQALAGSTRELLVQIEAAMAAFDSALLRSA